MPSMNDKDGGSTPNETVQHPPHDVAKAGPRVQAPNIPPLNSKPPGPEEPIDAVSAQSATDAKDTAPTPAPPLTLLLRGLGRGALILLILALPYLALNAVSWWLAPDRSLTVSVLSYTQLPADWEPASDEILAVMGSAGFAGDALERPQEQKSGGAPRPMGLNFQKLRQQTAGGRLAEDVRYRSADGADAVLTLEQLASTSFLPIARQTYYMQWPDDWHYIIIEGSGFSRGATFTATDPFATMIRADDLGMKTLTLFVPEARATHNGLSPQALKQALGQAGAGAFRTLRQVRYIGNFGDGSPAQTWSRKRGLPDGAMAPPPLRTPLADRARFFPTPVYAAALQDPAATTFPVLDAIEPPSLRLPLGVGYLVLLLALGLGLRRARNPLHHAPVLRWRFLVVAGIALPATWHLMVWGSWQLPLNWQPTGTPFLAMTITSVQAWLFPITAGVLGGLAMFRQGAPVQGAAPAAQSDRASLANDQAISDPEREDKLDFSPHVDALVHVLDNENTYPPLTISLNGPWGSGKTSIMRMVETRLKDTRRFDFVWFNAWQYRSEEQVLQAFLNAIGEQLTARQGLTFQWKILMLRFRHASTSDQIVYLLTLSVSLLGLLFAMVSIKSGLDLQNLGASFARISGGTAVWLGALYTFQRMIRPFQQPLALFSSAANAAGGVGDLAAVDRFNRDFGLVRQALGDRKLLVFIDDLDRAGPDEVVEVLKSINLISNAADGAGKTFFMLGFDWHYVLDMIAEHFQRKFRATGGVNADFPREYLKKIVTLSLSVPMANADQLQQLVTARAGHNDGPGAQPAAAMAETKGSGLLARFNLWLDQRADKLRDIMIVTTVLIGLALVWSLLPGMPSSETGKPTPAEPGITGQLAERPAATLPLPGPDGAGESTSPGQQPATVIVQPTGTGAIAPEYWIAAALGVAGILFYAAFSVLGESRRWANRFAPAERRDESALAEQINAIGAQYPANPRDAVRLINLVRMMHMLQKDTSGAFSVAQSARLAIWYYKWAKDIDAKRIEELFDAHENGTLQDILTTQWQTETTKPAPDQDHWFRKMRKSMGLVEGQKDDSALHDLRADLQDRQRVLRFLEIYRNLLSRA